MATAEPSSKQLPRLKGRVQTFSGGARGAAGDLRAGLAKRRVWLALAWNDIVTRYRRSMIGPFWLTVTMATTVSALGLLYSALFKVPLKDFLPYLSLGFIIWGFFSPSINEASTCFVKARLIIKQSAMPISVHLYRIIARNFIILLHNMPIYVALAFIFQIPITVNTLFFIPGMMLLIAIVTGISLFIATISARFRDIPSLISNVLQVTFYLSPVLWQERMLSEGSPFVTFNPLRYLLDIVRRPLLNEAVPGHFWLVAIGILVVSWALALGFYLRFRRRIAYWV